MGPTWVLSAPGGPHVGPMNLAIRVAIGKSPLWNSHIWQSLSLRDWRWKAAVTLGWMGATFSGSGSWPPRGYRHRHLGRPMRILMMREIYMNSCIVTTFHFFSVKVFFNPNCVLIISKYFILWNSIVCRTSHSYWRWDKSWDKIGGMVELSIFM